MSLTLEARRYRRHLRRPMVNHHGFMAERSGIIIRLTDADGRRGYGEIAPLKWFGTETFQDAWAFVASLGTTVTDMVWAEVPPSLPCCRFAMDCALAMLEDEAPAPDKAAPMEIAGLLPAGEMDWVSAGVRIQEGYRSLKWKVGVESFEEEVKHLDRLLEIVHGRATLRLDANGGMDLETAERWVRHLAPIEAIDFLEQPLPIRNIAGHRKLAALADELGRRELVALDESLNDPGDMSDVLSGGWSGVYVCKPVVQGARDAIAQWQSMFGDRLVFSSAFETAIGVEAILNLAARGAAPRSLGLGTLGFFEEDGLGFHAVAPQLKAGTMGMEVYEAIWEWLL